MTTQLFFMLRSMARPSAGQARVFE